MIKSNCKKALDKIRGYIMENHDFDGYDGVPENEDLHSVCCFIYKVFTNDKRHDLIHCNHQTIFSEWCSGLPDILDTMYHCNVSAVDLVGDILEQTEEERRKYDEQTAEDYMDWLLYREIMKEVRKEL